ncbi:cold-inducible protein YdjO-related protein [Paenibacillus sp. R14(2021)]|uniref:cold-inducible protein YdjO-related protein n=1 Tax=Paenibacillus sp. R14(2021) TaxID=2859228 RepID=UPI00280BA6D6|nr:cold-inducible protein YdjO-related protein [Paenibacillus sp. R14(2021)]
MTTIWSCTKEDCNGWMRISYSFEDVPTCAQCKSPMIHSQRELPVLPDANNGLKTGAKNAGTTT